MNKGVMDNISRQHFAIPLKQNNTRVFHIVPLLMLLLSFGIFSFDAVLQKKVLLAACMVAAIILTIYWLHLAWVGRHISNLIYLALLFAAVYWFVQLGVGLFMGALLLLAALLNTRLKEKQEIVVTDEGIIIKMFWNKMYSWQELVNVIIKDGLVTIDCKNNKIFQKEAGIDITAQYEAEFNEFCRLKIIAVK